jgi:NADH:ubiquinone oxidoreductase subunit 3 (subunit A)
MSSMIFLYLFVSILALAFLAINFLFATHKPYLEKDSIFECGFHSFRDQNRQPFHVLFYMYAMLYLLFDLELTLIGPAEWSGKSLVWVKLSNSGDSLKLLVPNYTRKIISGWSNYSCTVTSQKMIEKEMGYRGSKSITDLHKPTSQKSGGVPSWFQGGVASSKSVIVKEQRVDGSWHGFYVASPCLRCTLMGFERNYQVKIPSKQINKRSYTLIATHQPLIHQPAMNPWFLTGLTDGDGCFCISIIKNNKYRLGWRVQQSFTIGLHEKDKALLQQIQSYFGGIGNIHNSGPQLLQYRIYSVKDLKVVINHFEKYPLITQKWSDSQLFKQAWELIERKEHLTQQGLEKLVSIKAYMNLGLSSELKAGFPNTLPLARPLVQNLLIPDPQWVAGFTEAEGCFYVGISKNSIYNAGSRVKLRFGLTQHSRDRTLMESLIKFWDCGSLEQPLDYNHVHFRISKFSDLHNKLVPFFQKYPLHGVKRLDYLDWCKVAELMQNKAHLTVEGLNEIRQIKAGMNKGRPDGDGL